MRRPSPYAQNLLVELLNSAQLAPAALVQVLLDLGFNQFNGAIDTSGAPKAALGRVVDAVSRAGLLKTEVMDGIEALIPQRAGELMVIRVEMELVESPTALVASSMLDALKKAALFAGLGSGVLVARLRAKLPPEVRRRSAQITNDEPDELRAWFDAANRQLAEPDANIWMLDLLTAAIEVAPVLKRGPLQQLLEQLRVTALGGDPRAGEPPAPKSEGLESLVNDLGIAVDGGQFYERMGQALARICLIRQAGQDLGTGFLVGDDLVLTNHHVLLNVIAGGGAAEDIAFVFDYRWRAGEVTEGPSARLSMAGASAANTRPWLLDASEPTALELTKGSKPDITLATPEQFLDFALVRLDTPMGTQPDAQGSPRGHFTLRKAGPPFGFPLGTALIVIGHRQAEDETKKAAPQTFAIEPNSVLAQNPNGTRVRYRTNTLPGSSGSPVLTVGWELVALHHFGKQHQYNQGIPTSAIAARPGVSAAVT